MYGIPLTKQQLDAIKVSVEYGSNTAYTTLYRGTVDRLISTIEVLRDELVDAHMGRFNRVGRMLQAASKMCQHPYDGKMCPDIMRLHHFPPGWKD